MNHRIWIFSLLSLLMLHLACTVRTIPDAKRVGQFDIVGKVVDQTTGHPLEGVLVIATVKKEKVFSLISYDIGHTYTNVAGEFVIPANPQTLYYAAPGLNTPMDIETIKYGYTHQLYSVGSQEQTPPKIINLIPTTIESQMYDEKFRHRTSETRELIKSMMVKR
jgi:hypothetical protein